MTWLVIVGDAIVLTAIRRQKNSCTVRVEVTVPVETVRVEVDDGR